MLLEPFDSFLAERLEDLHVSTFTEVVHSHQKIRLGRLARSLESARDFVTNPILLFDSVHRGSQGK